MKTNWPEFNKPVKKVAFLGTAKAGEGIKAIRAKTVPVSLPHLFPDPGCQTL